MRKWRTAMLVAAAAWGAWAGAAAGQRREPASRNLEGLWSRASLTTLERPGQFKGLVAAEAEARAFEAGHLGRPAFPFADDVGQDEGEWWDMGVGLARIDGQARTSWITDPADGRLPLSEAGLARVRERQASILRDFDGPEARPSPERCLTATGGSAAPPMMNTSYNNHLQIVQAPGHVVLVAEMNHDVRILPVGGAAAPLAPLGTGLSWYGRPVARWQGNTLVVESTGFRAETAWRFPGRLYVSPGARVTERFTRVGADELRYAFTVDDPANYTRVWSGEMPLKRAKGPMYEFACHEGNYSMAGALGGARR